MDAMPMHASGAMSMWMRMPGQSWAGTAASFLAMWTAMMVAMMLPSFVPTLWRYRAAVRRAGFTGADQLTALVGIAYFGVWAAVGAVVFPFGVALSALAMGQTALARLAPIAVGATVLLAGIAQHSRWKARQLALCREPVHGHTPATGAHAAWRHGIRLGLRCVASCAGLTAAGLVVGVMDLRVMAIVTTAITAERLVPADRRVARAIGDLAVVAGLVLIARAVSLV